VRLPISLLALPSPAVPSEPGAISHVGQCSGMSPDAAWAEADELRVAERSTFESNIYVQPEEAAERGVKRCRGT
jgi:hypothetical protein